MLVGLVAAVPGKGTVMAAAAVAGLGLAGESKREGIRSETQLWIHTAIWSGGAAAARRGARNVCRYFYNI